MATTAVEALDQILSSRWTKRRPGSPPKAGNQQELVFEGQIVGPVPLRPVLPNTIIIKPPLGRLHVQLFDKTGRVQHAKRDYKIDGPESFSGTTDDVGILRHEEVFPGDYTLSLTLTFFEGEDQQEDVYESPLVTLRPAEAKPEVRMLGAVPISVLVRLHLFFNTNKCFLLPTALPEVRRLRKLYQDNNPSVLLAVGHADTTGGSDYNDKLSLERAQATIAFLQDDVDGWLGFYESGAPAKKRWGAPEDRMMLMALPDFGSKPKGEDAVRWFQRTRDLTVDGKSGPLTRRQLITEYMALDGASVEEVGIEIDATAHGCGENFPLDERGEEIDAAPEGQKRDPGDRRVELFFFDPEFGAEVFFAELVDAHFRSDSAVVLPEGESPTDREDQLPSLTSVSVFATALRFNDEHTGRKILVAGHADTTASTDFNQTLSEERARCALALLLGGDEQRDAFKSICDGRHTVADGKEILAWASRAFPELDFDCDPGKIDDNASTAVEPIRRFQRAYNLNKDALGASGPDLDPDGDLGPLTWGAIFDCYEFALQQELGEDAAGLAELRQKLIFVDDQRRALGFSEYFPIEELGVDDYRSQANRRVEILFFESGEEPDLGHAEEDPETSELYLPGIYRRTPISEATAKRVVMPLRLESADGFPLPGIEYVVSLSDGTERKGRLDRQGSSWIKAVDGTEFDVEYLELDKIRATALAARLASALDAANAPTILGVVARSEAEFKAVREVIEEFFPRDGDLIEEIRSATRGSEVADAVDYYLTGLGFGDADTNTVVVFQDPTVGSDSSEGGVAVA